LFLIISCAAGPEIAARSIRQDRASDNSEEMISSWRGRRLVAEPRKRSS